MGLLLARPLLAEQARLHGNLNRRNIWPARCSYGLHWETMVKFTLKDSLHRSQTYAHALLCLYSAETCTMHAQRSTLLQCLPVPCTCMTPPAAWQKHCAQQDSFCPSALSPSMRSPLSTHLRLWMGRSAQMEPSHQRRTCVLLSGVNLQQQAGIVRPWMAAMLAARVASVLRVRMHASAALHLHV